MKNSQENYLFYLKKTAKQHKSNNKTKKTPTKQN